MCDGPDSRTGLQRLHAERGERGNCGVHVVNFEQDVMQSAALLLQEVLVSIPIAFNRLNELKFQISGLCKHLAKLDALFFAPVPILRIRPIRPFDESEWAHSKKFSQQFRRSFQIANHYADLYRPI